MNYPGGPNILTKVLNEQKPKVSSQKRKERESDGGWGGGGVGGAGRGGRLEGSTQLILKVKGGSTSQRMQMSLKVRKGKKTDYSLKPP